ncbi:MAG TPA: response regulator transcription factor [Candidatus Acidoferrum sp.]|nr:response regulator transcription factor [Candidatus Acidoferrum sp.]
MKVITLLIVSNEAISRSGVKHLLGSEAGFHVMGEGAYKEATLLASKLKPDVVIVVAEAGAQPGCVQLIGSVRKAACGAEIVILGRETHHAYVGLLLASGALGYVLLQARPRELFNAVRAVSRGRRFVDQNIGDELYKLFSLQAGSSTKLLSQREQQVLEMLAFGHTLVEIASFLSISQKSIETYRARIREKLGLRTRAEIVRYALQAGILNGEDQQAS